MKNFKLYSLERLFNNKKIKGIKNIKPTVYLTVCENIPNNKLFLNSVREIFFIYQISIAEFFL